MSTKNSRVVRTIPLAAALALAGVALIGCKPKEREGAPGESAAATPAMAPAGTSTTARPADTTAAAAPSGGVAADPSISSWTDENIVAKLEAGDTKEVEVSRLVEPKLTNAEVKEYARTLTTDHSKSRSDMRDVARKAKLVARMPAGDTSQKELADIKARFQKMARGAAFDTAFVNAEIDDHQHDIANHRAMQTQAKSKELKDEIGKGLPVLQKHLDKAQELNRKLTGART